MAKKIIIMVVIMVTCAMMLIGCNNGVQKYNAVLYDNAGKSMQEEFLIENLTRDAYYKGIDTNDSAYPVCFTHIIRSKEEFDKIFTNLPTIINFEKEMVCIYIFTDNYIKPYKINKVSIDKHVLKIEVKSTDQKPGEMDSVRSWQRCLVVKIDKLDINSVEFNEI